jgi:dihydroorotase
MTQSYDLILKGATVVNHDGEGARDLAIWHGRIAAIGDLSRTAASDRSS